LKIIFKFLPYHSHPLRTYKSKYINSSDFNIIKLNDAVENLITKFK